MFNAAHDLATTSSNMGTAEPVLQSRGIDRSAADTGDSHRREGWIGSIGNRHRGNAIDGVGSDLQQHRLGTPARPRREPRSEALPSLRSHIFFSSFQITPAKSCRSNFCLSVFLNCKSQASLGGRVCSQRLPGPLPERHGERITQHYTSVRKLPATPQLCKGGFDRLGARG